MTTWEKLGARFHEKIRPLAERRVGIEIERIGMWRDGHALHYSPGKSPSGEMRPGAEQLLTELQRRHPSWETVTSPEGKPLGFHAPFGKVSLEPGSQLELSADPVIGIREIVEQVEGFEKLVDAVGAPWGLRWIGLGLNPVSTVDSIDVIPSPRYGIMTDYLGKRGQLGTSMMRLTSSIQINLDYTSEKEAIEMLQAALAAAPVSYALFGNSPISHGKPTGHLSYRAEIWRQTDPDRTGLLPEVFATGFDFEEYARLLWKRPLMFAQDPQGRYIPAEGKSLADIEAGRLPGAKGDDHNITNSVQEIFTEARLKPGYIEVRSIDGLLKPDRYAAAAFWLGLLYNADARRLAIEKLGKIPATEKSKLWSEASLHGLNGKAGELELLSIAKELVAAARRSLVDRRRGEEIFLDPLDENLERKTNPGQRVLEQFSKVCKGDIPALLDYSTI